MATHTTSSDVPLGDVTTEVVAVDMRPVHRGQASFVFAAFAATNLNTYYRMEGFDTISGTRIAWTVQDTPDPTAARHPTPAAVSVTGGQIIDRFQA